MREYSGNICQETSFLRHGSKTVLPGLLECPAQLDVSWQIWPITREKPPGMAVLGSVGMDAVAPGSSGWIPYNHFISEI